jgi:N4-gp56 family major capsid protein
MATTDYPVNHPLAVKLWSKKIAREALRETMAMKFMGTSSNNLIQVFDDTSKGSGDRVRVPLRMQLSGRGVGETEALEGNEEALTTYQDDVVINDLAHAVRVKTTIDAQRVPFSVREEARLGIQDWYADRIDQSIANQLTGNTGQTDVLYTGNNTAVAPSSGTGTDRRWLIRQQDDETDHTTEASLSTSDTFSLRLLDRAVAIAKTTSPLIRPVKVGAQSYYVAFLHPFQVRDLRTQTNTGDWLDIQKAAMGGGDVESNPIFTGALGVYNGVVLHEWTRLPNGIGANSANTRRAVFCGAQSLGLAWGSGYSEAPKYIEDLFDYDRQFGVSVQSIIGAKKLQFNSKDFGTIVMSTWAAAP